MGQAPRELCPERPYSLGNQDTAFQLSLTTFHLSTLDMPVLGTPVLSLAKDVNWLRETF